MSEAMTSADVRRADAPVDRVDDGGRTSDRRDWLAGRPTRRADLAVAAGVGLVVIAVAYAFRSVVVPADPWHYIRSAIEFPSDRWVALGYTRYGIVLPAIPVARVFGAAQVTYYFWPLLSAGVLAASTYLLGRRWWGPVAGLTAVVLLVANRIVFYNLSRGYPDIMSMALFAVAVLAALAARDRLVAGRGAAAWLLAVGFLLGWGFEVRETSMLAWPLIALILWRKGRLLSSALLVGLPLLGWAAVDVGVSAWAYGDPLLKYHVLTGLDVSAARTKTGEVKNALMLGQPRLFYFTYIPERALERPGGLSMVLMGAAALVGLFVRNGGVRLVSLWFLVVYGLTTLAGGGLDPDHPRGLLHVERYWIPFFPATALATAGLATLAAGWVVRRTPLRDAPGWARRAPALALCVLLCAAPLAFVSRYAATDPAFPPGGGAALEELRSELGARGFAGGRVFTDWETVRILPAYQKPFFGGDNVWPGEPRSITGPVKPRPGDHVLLFSATSETCPFCRNALAPWLEKHPEGPPRSWEVLYTAEHDNLVLYRVR
jgi:hypothetical protein